MATRPVGFITFELMQALLVSYVRLEAVRLRDGRRLLTVVAVGVMAIAQRRGEAKSLPVVLRLHGAAPSSLSSPVSRESLTPRLTPGTAAIHLVRE